MHAPRFSTRGPWPLSTRPARVRLWVATLPLLAASLFLAGCSSGPAGSGAPKAKQSAGARMGDDRMVRVKELSAQDMEEFRAAFGQFVGDHPLWPISIRSWLERGGAAPYVLSENLFRFFWSASAGRQQQALVRVREVAGWIGEPAVAYFAKPLVTDEVPLDQPVTVDVPDPDDPRATKKKTFDRFKMDDVTRQDAARVLAAIGDPAVPTLSSPAVLRDARPTARRFALYALGRIASPTALQALMQAAATQSDWQDRAAAVQGLGVSLEADPQIRVVLEKALTDSDPFVRRKAEEALSGRSRLPL